MYRFQRPVLADFGKRRTSHFESISGDPTLLQMRDELTAKRSGSSSDRRVSVPVVGIVPAAQQNRDEMTAKGQ